MSPKVLIQNDVLKKTPLNFNYLPEASLSEGLALLKRHLFDNLPCDEEMRYLVLCWTSSILLRDENRNKAILHFYGPSGSGKSAAASMLSALIEGEDRVGQVSAAAAFTDHADDALLIQENLEFQDHLNGMVNFFLLSASSGYQKRRVGMTGAESLQRVHCNVLTTSIEPIPEALPELTQRTLQVRFDSVSHRSSSHLKKAIESLRFHRDIILSSMLQLAQIQILSSDHAKSNWHHYLTYGHANHRNSRLNDFIASLLVTLEALLPFIPYSNPIAEPSIPKILKKWIDQQAGPYKVTCA